MNHMPYIHSPGWVESARTEAPAKRIIATRSCILIDFICASDKYGSENAVELFQEGSWFSFFIRNRRGELE